MTDDLKRSRNDSYVKYVISFFCLLFTIFSVCIGNYLLEGKYLWKGEEKNVLHWMYLGVISILNIPCYGVFFYNIISYHEEENPVSRTFQDLSKNYKWLIYIIILSILILPLISYVLELETSLLVLSKTAFLFVLFCLSIGLLLASIFNCFNYDDAELSYSQNSEQSIGAAWAIGTYKAYYEVIEKDIVKRMKEFEKENNIPIKLKKFITICPLSCNIDGTLEHRDGKIFCKGQLRAIDFDQGANMNRKYAPTVYGIKCIEGEVLYFVAQFFSPLGVLWKGRHSMHKAKLVYHRDSAIKTLKDLLKDHPNTITLEYDDENPSGVQSLSDFLISSIDKCMQDKNGVV